MRICIVGCGAIGSLFAAHLAQLPEVEIWAYDTSAAHVDAINRAGLRIVGRENLVARVNATAKPDRIPACEFGIVAVKGTFTKAAIAETAHAFEDAAVCSVQNGIGNEEVIAEHVPRVMRGVTLAAVRVAGPGVVEMNGSGTTWVGPFEARPATLDDVQQLGLLLSRSGLETHAVTDARGAQWDQAPVQLRDQPVMRADRPDPRTAVRAAGDPGRGRGVAARRPGGCRRLRDRFGRGSRGAR
jgi:2-dehydropantoate 2-reductase